MEFFMLKPVRRLLTAALVLTPASSHAETLNVVVTIAPIHSLAVNILQGVAEPKLLLTGGASAHTYSLKPSDAKALQTADVVVQASEGYEVFLQKALKTLPKNARILTMDKAPGMTLLPVREGGGFEEHDHHDHGAGHGHKHKHGGEHGHKHPAKAAEKHDDGAGHDVHIWFDPLNAMAMADAMAAGFAEAAPQHAETIKANAEKTKARLKALNEETRAMLTPVANRPFLVFHDIIQYLEKRYGVTAVGAVTLSPERQPSAKRLSEVHEKIKTLGAACVFSEPQFSPKLVDTITSGAQVRRGTLDEIGVGLKPGADLYFEFIRMNAKSLAGCLS
jgi:zinc transport system substrate-binding protein